MFANKTVVILTSLAFIAFGASANAGQLQHSPGFASYNKSLKDQVLKGTRKSLYVKMRDGKARAVDIFLPLGAEKMGKRLPVIYHSDRYNRAYSKDSGRIDSRIAITERDGSFTLKQAGPSQVISDRSNHDPQLSWLFRNGYAIVVADMRGTGASEGSEIEFASQEAVNDEEDIINWIGKQTWSNGKVGMIGVSYGAESQYMAAASGSPYLKAIFPIFAEFDEYYGDGYGTSGIRRFGWLDDWTTSWIAADDTPEAQAPKSDIAPVDDDNSGMRLADILVQRKTNVRASAAQTLRENEMFGKGNFFLDSVPWLTSFQKQGPNHLVALLPRLNETAVPFYAVAGSMDLFSSGNVRFYSNINAPKRLLVLPSDHSSVLGTGLMDRRNIENRWAIATESLRWFDYWLKDVENGVASGPPVMTAAFDKGQDVAWFHGYEWPLAGTFNQSFRLAKGPSGAANSVNDGGLVPFAHEPVAKHSDTFTVDYTTTTGRANRWFQLGDEGQVYWQLKDRRDAAKNGLTYTSPVLENDMAVVGNPVITAYITSSAADVDLYAYLEEVSPDGTVTYVTEGMVRASHRMNGRAPYNNHGMPYPLSYSHIVKAAEPLNTLKEPAKVDFELLATATIFNKGNRMRITFVGADAGNTSTQKQIPAPKIILHMGVGASSYIDLPVKKAFNESNRHSFAKP
jgi:uncharacterized protein